MIRLIVTDMDGTLLDDKGELTNDFYDIFNELYQRNIFFCVASGRQYPSLLQFFQEQKQKMGFIAENGGYVMFQGQEIYQKSIDNLWVKQILSACESIPEIGVTLCAKQKAYLNSSCQETILQVQKHYPALEFVKDFNHIDESIFKITIYDRLGPQNNSLLKLQSFQDKVKIVRSGDSWLDITNIEVNKGVAVEFIQQKMGITKQETMVFGDYMNDIEMMHRAEYSYAMKNAQSEVKKVANFVTQYDHSQQGVLKTITQVLGL